MTRMRTLLLAATLLATSAPLMAQSMAGGSTASQGGFGRALAIAANNELLVGEPNNQTKSGIVYVYRKTNGKWTEAAKLTPEIVESLQTLNAAEIRLDAPIGDSDDSQLVERFMSDEAQEPEEAVEERLLAEQIDRALDTLTPRDARVVRLYFGLDGGREHTLEEIGNMLGVMRERVRQLRDRALKRLREGDLGDALESFAA